MIYSGTAISVQALDGGIAEFKFDLANESVNKFNRATVEDLAPLLPPSRPTAASRA